MFDNPDKNASPHRRYNPLDESWVLVSPHRTQRPWQGETVAALPDKPVYAEECYLCPGNARAGSATNPDYTGVFVFDNDFAALLTNSAEPEEEGSDLFQSHTEKGRSRVVCYSPQHNLSLGGLSAADMQSVIKVWVDEYETLIADYSWVQIFENRGAAMGASNPHPHGQIWAQDHLPTLAAREVAAQHKYRTKNGSVLLLDYALAEVERADRLVVLNDDWVVVVPYWAAWPFETLLLPRVSVAHLGQLTASQKVSLGSILQRLQLGYDALFDCEFPYSFGWHNAPAESLASNAEGSWQLHAHFYPPLLRSASVKKFMVGYEMMAEPQRDLTPELAAANLRAVMPAKATPEQA